ncbi:HNH endonuclease, partial [Vibrio phage 184E37-3b]
MFDKVYNVFLPQPLVWKDVEGLEGYYQVSNYGEVRSLDREVTYLQRSSVVTRTFYGKVLSPKLDKDGYESYGLSKDKTKHHLRGHRIVAKAFVPNNGALPVVDHKNGTVTHNFSWNLQWMTSQDNTIKYYAKEFNKEKTLSSLSKEDWFYIGWLYKEGVSYEGITENLGLTLESPYSIWDGLSGRRLSSITGFKQGDFKVRAHPTTKLTLETVVTIIKERKVGNKPLKVLSKKYNITESMISRFCSGKRQPEALKLFKER